MTDGADPIKRLDVATRKALRLSAKESAIAGENIISQLRDRAAVWELSSSELAALTESATMVSKVRAGFDAALRMNATD